MTTYEELCITAEHRAKLWADAKVEQLKRMAEDNLTTWHMLESEIWNAYQAGFKAGHDHYDVQQRTAYKDSDS